MSTALMPAPTNCVATAQVTPEQMDLIRRTVAKDATPDELRLYLYDCARQGVHPLDKLIHFTKRGGKYTPVTSIDFMRIQAANSGECVGSTDPAFTGVPKSPEFAATVTVRRVVQGIVADFTATARWAEYFPGEAQGHMWKKMPHTMLGKCAEALALRKGFPKQLAGLYAREEMEQASESHATSVVAAPVVEATPVDDGKLRVVEVRNEPTSTGKARWRVVFSDGVETTTFKEQLSALAETLCQSRAEVTYEAKPPGKWGTDLVSMARVDADHDQAAPLGDEPPPITDADIPF